LPGATFLGCRGPSMAPMAILRSKDRCTSLPAFAVFDVKIDSKAKRSIAGTAQKVS